MNTEEYGSSQRRVRVDPRKNGKYRLRFNTVHEDQLELIMNALDLAKRESGTRYDTVALTNICLHYIANS